MSNHSRAKTYFNKRVERWIEKTEKGKKKAEEEKHSLYPAALKAQKLMWLTIRWPTSYLQSSENEKVYTGDGYQGIQKR